jgi:hypothetical protein
MTRRRGRRAAVPAAILTLLVLSVATAKEASAGPVRHVPMAWCIVNGSPAQAAPNILNEGTTITDTNTDAVIWRRHERPTDNIFIPQANISLRSAINSTSATFNFPFLADPDTARGQPGDVNGWNVNTDATEFTTLINNCDTAYNNLMRAGIGVTSVNVGLFHDNANMANDGNTQFDYVTVIGWGGCTETTPGTCVTPYDGRIMVIDNNYLYPTVADRTWPASPADPMGNFSFLFTDPLDQLVGHEIGHALSLNHRTDMTALMNPSQADSNADGRADNIALNATEVSALRANANNVPGLETDPPGEFTPGRTLAMRLPDGRRDKGRRPYHDLAALTVALDQRRGRVHVGQQLWGLLPRKPPRTTRYGFVVDLDNRPRTGAPPRTLARLGLPTRFRGADLIARARVVGSRRLGPGIHTWRATAMARVFEAGGLRTLPPGAFDVQVQTLRMHPHFSPVRGLPVPADFVAEVYNTVNFTVRNRALPNRIRPGVPFRVQALAGRTGRIPDQLGRGERGGRFILERPRFAHCFPAGEVAPGDTVEVTFDGLRPNREIHALLGPDLVLRGVTTDSRGAGRIMLPIPTGTRPGRHLVTIGHDGLALTADCTVTVRG